MAYGRYDYDMDRVDGSLTGMLAGTMLAVLISTTEVRPMREIQTPAERYIYTYGAHHPPIATVEPGETVAFCCPDCFANRVTCESHLPAERCVPPYFVDPVVGPVLIRGAQPGDTLRVEILSIKADRDFAVTALCGNFGGLTRTEQTPMLHEALPEQTRIMPIRDGLVWFNDKIQLPFRPFIGCIAVAPYLEAIKSVAPGYFGGNMDCLETVAGNTIRLPVSHEGAHFFVGDAHACQGDGEVSGVAAEISSRITLRFEVEKGRKINWPRIESATHLMVAGSGRPMEDAARIAYMELIQWMVAEYGFDKFEAYQLLSLCGEVRLGNMVDPNYTIVAKIAKDYLNSQSIPTFFHVTA